MDKKLEVIQKKFELVTSEEYKKIRDFQLKNILHLSSTGIDPQLIKGMLYNVYSTDQWEQDFYSEKEKE